MIGWLQSEQLALKPNQPVTSHWGHLGSGAAMCRLRDGSSSLTLKGGPERAWGGIVTYGGVYCLLCGCPSGPLVTKSDMKVETAEVMALELAVTLGTRGFPRQPCRCALVDIVDKG